MLGNIPDQLSAQTQARYAQVSDYDYGSVGDQRPYQIVFPAYKAPKFLQTYANLWQGLRECSTLCQEKGLPFRLVKWGAKHPCFPCKGKKIRDARLPGFRVVYSNGALEGYPDAMPIADFQPTGERIVYGPDGQEKLVGSPNYVISSTPYPSSGLVNFSPLPMRYVEAIQSAMYLANQTGKTTFLCSSFGEKCADDSNWFPVVYVQPGGVVARYPHELDLGPGTVPGSTNVVTNVSPSEYDELIAESQGATFLGQGA